MSKIEEALKHCASEQILVQGVCEGSRLLGSVEKIENSYIFLTFLLMLIKVIISKKTSAPSATLGLYSKSAKSGLYRILLGSVHACLK